MNNTHTKSPWTCRQDSYWRFYVEHVSGDLKSRIAQLDDSTLCLEHGGSIEGNARLIAKAPEMRELLIELQDVLDDYSDVSDGGDGIANVPNAAMRAREQIRALLAEIDN